MSAAVVEDTDVDRERTKMFEGGNKIKRAIEHS